jgi:hypothetical protein
MMKIKNKKTPANSLVQYKLKLMNLSLQHSMVFDISK